MTVFVIPIWLFEFWDALGYGEGLAFLRDVAAFVRLRPQRLETSLAGTQPSWIDRVWIVQEFLLANKLYICFGSVRMKYDWTTLCGMYHTADLGFEYDMPPFKHLIDRLSPYGLLKIQRTNGWSQHRKPDVLSIMLATRQAEATHPVDKIWGVFALISSEGQSNIKLNYTMPISDAYIQATFASMDCIGTLDILHLAGLGQSKIEGLPTWAADFTQSATKLEFATHEPWLETPKLPGLPGLPVHNTFEEKRLEPSEAPLWVPRVLRAKSVNRKAWRECSKLPSIVCAEQETEGKAKFFTTTSGFLGLGRGDVLEGDIVVAVPGARLPLVLRRREDTSMFTFRGFAFTHGVMFGELMSMMIDSEKNGELDRLMEDFVLC
ncbi:hypothetical protein LTR78_007742 [Recurvomyces mirabilis]|uniref:Heterokaryon incompatibility domain-containing protein n=1 Tax=Recurvomyces mirabilis TaxID=574656 RepID=A0AAE0WG10_9PEZI|nr:hypothetical protein LTR78_007742 [Recurvomyces mirabilis]KAK5151630.1 hypothetical protein LTS14_009117 [Recurvomyces mirabilis]